MKVGSTDALIAVLDAASAYINHLAAEELPPKRVLRMAHSSALRARETLDRVGLPASLASSPRRDDTDELIGRALGTGLPMDDGPEGVADASAPIATDETSDDLVSFAVPDELEQPEAPFPVEVEYDPDSVGGVVIDDEITLKSSERSAGGESFDLMPDAHEDEDEDDTGDGPTSIGSDLEGEIHADPDSAINDSPSVSEVIVSKQDAAAEVASLRSEVSPALVSIPDDPEPEEEVYDPEAVTADHGVVEADEEATSSTERSSLQDAITASSEADEPTGTEADVTEDTQSPVDPSARQAVPVAGISMGGRAVASAASFNTPSAVPTIRDQSTPKPRAAAIQLGNDEGSPVVLGMEEEDEPIAVGGAEDDDDYDFDPEDYDPDAGFSLQVEEYEEYEEDDEEDIEPEPEPEPEPEVPALPEVDIAGSLKRAQEAAEDGKLDDAVDLFSDVLDADYDNVEALVGRGRAQLVLGDFARAMSDFTIAAETAPQDPEPLIAIGDLYFERKDYKSAISYYDAGLQADPSHALGFCRRGISHYSRKDYTAAVADLNKAKELDPDLANIGTYISMAKKKARR